MSKKSKNSKTKPAVSGVIVQFIPKQDEYQKHLEVFRSLPTLPVWFAMLEAAIDAGISLDFMLNEIQALTNKANDQYFGAFGSRFFMKNRKELDAYREFRASEQGVIWAANQLWMVLGRFSNGDVHQYNDCLMGDVDHYALMETDDVQEEAEAAPEQYLQNDYEFESLRNATVDAIKFQEEHAANVTKISDSLGLSYVPYAVWSYELLSGSAELRSGISDFSKYLGSFFAPRDELDMPELGFRANQVRLHADQSLALAKIASFVLFEPLMRKVVYGCKESDVSTYFDDRLKYLAEIDALETDEDKSNYIIAITNLQLICAKLEVESVAAGIVTEQERSRSYFARLDRNYLAAASLITVPPAGFAQTLSMYNPYDSDHEYIEIHRLLKVSGFGIIRHYDDYDIDSLFDTVYKGLDEFLVNAIRGKAEQSVKRWVIPLSCVGKLTYIYDRFLDEKDFMDEISSSLRYADVHKIDACIFDRQDIDGGAMQPWSFSKSMHPAIFARQFSNRADFAQFDDKSWLKFTNSLVDAGMTRYACVLLALFFNMKAIQHGYSFGKDERLNIPILSKLLNTLQSFGSFNLVKSSIKDYLDVTQEDVHLVGSLFDFLPSDRKVGDVITLKQSFEQREESHLNVMKSAGIEVSGLCRDAEKYLVKGHMLVHDQFFSKARLLKEALANYYWAIESELRSRISVLNESLSMELQSLGIDIKLTVRTDDRPGKIGEIIGLGGIARIVNAFNRLSESGKSKLEALRPLFHHQDRALFISNLSLISDMRNVLSHPKRITEQQVDEYVQKTEELLFGTGRMISVLRDTA